MTVAAAVAIAAVSLPRLAALPLNHDVATYALLVDRWLAGETPYEDFVQINAPLPLFLYLPPGWIAHATAQSWEAVILAGTVALCGVVAYASWHLAGAARSALVVAITWLALWYVTYDLGQRDTAMALAVLPFALAKARRADGGHVAVGFAATLGAVAGIAFAIKPFFLAIWAGIEVASAVPTRSPRALVRPESASALVSWLACTGLVFAYPEYLRFVVPLARATYGREGVPLATAMAHPGALAAVFAVAATLTVGLVRWREEGRPPATSATLCGAAIGAIVSYAAQSKGWTYHLYPACFFGLLALVAVWPPRGLALRGFVGTAGALVVAVLALVGTIEHRQAMAHAQDPEVTTLTRIVAERAHEKPVLWLSDDLYYLPQATHYGGGRHAGTFTVMWMIPGLYRDRREPDLYADSGAADRLVLERIAGDLERAPALVFVQAEPRPHLIGDSAFRYEDWLRHDERTARAFAAYELVATTALHRVYAPR